MDDEGGKEVGSIGEGKPGRGGWRGSQVVWDGTGLIKNFISDPRSNAEPWDGISRAMTPWHLRREKGAPAAAQECVVVEETDDGNAHLLGGRKMSV